MTSIHISRVSFCAVLAILSIVFSNKTPFPQGEIYSDGPYLIYSDSGLVAAWMDENTKQVVAWPPPNDWTIPDHVSPSFDPDFIHADYEPAIETQLHFTDVARIAAISDIHGQFDVARKLLHENGIIDDRQNWSFGEGHLVVTGDVFDRGDQVTETLWLLYKLEQQAAAAGGRVHYLLGNHEMLVLHGDLRYLHQKYRYTTAALQMTFASLLDESSYLGRWLRTRPIAITINEMAFVHGGFSPRLIEELPSLEKINSLFHTRIINAQPEVFLTDPLLNFLYLDEGPLWYRGYFAQDELEKKDVKRILKKLNVDRIVVGHTSFKAITPVFDKRIVGIDSSIKLGKTGEVLLYESGLLYRGDIFGKKTLL